MTSYFIDKFTVTKNQLEWVDRMTIRYNPDTSLLFRHILASTIVQKHLRGHIPISHDLIKRKAPEADWRRLKADGLVTVSPFNMDRGISNRFVIPTELVEAFSLLDFKELDPATVKDYTEQPKYNLMTGRPLKSSVEKSETYDRNRNPHPSIVQEAMACISTGYYNQDAILAHLKRQKTELEKLDKSDSKRERLSGRFINDLETFKRVLRQGRKETKWPGVYNFPLSWTPTSTGRISGGFQSASREMKQAAFDIPDCHNYDFQKSQAFLLAISLFQHGLTSEWLLRLFNDKGFRKEQAQRLGISEDCFKNCLYAVFFGANPDYYNSDIMDHLEEELPTEEASKAKNEFSKLIRPLREDLEQWYKSFLQNCQQSGDYRGYKVSIVGGKTRITNLCGKSVILENFKDSEAPRKVASHILQGIEAAITHAFIIVLTKEKGLGVISHEHDGFVLLGSLEDFSDEEVEQIRDRVWELSGIDFETPWPVKKPFC